MELKLRVEAGKNAGQEIRVPGAQFVIGRGDECQLRAVSDMVSRRHCVLIVADSYAGVRDLGSKNGTFVNGEMLQNREAPLHNGDKLRIGPLEFSVVLNAGLTGKKRPAVHDMREAVARTASGTANTDDDIASWLMDGGESKGKKQSGSGDTQQMKMSDTEEIDLSRSASDKTTILPAQGAPDQVAKSSPAAAESSVVAGGEGMEKKSGPMKKVPSKLPSAGSNVSNTRDAASEIIERMRKRR